jgi:hypothetical protein
MTAKTVVLMLFLASVVDALVLETAMRASVLSRATSATMIWDPTKDEIFDRKSHMLQHSEEALPMYVGPPPGYSKPEDGCEEVNVHWQNCEPTQPIPSHAHSRSGRSHWINMQALSLAEPVGR